MCGNEDFYNCGVVNVEVKCRNVYVICRAASRKCKYVTQMR